MSEPAQTNKVELFQRAVGFADRTAFSEQGLETSYADLLARSGDIAAGLLNGSADLEEARIAFAAPGGSDYAAIQWGVWRAGGIAVPLNIHSTPPEIRHCLDSAGVKRLIALPNTIDKMKPLCDEMGIELCAAGDFIGAEPAVLPELELSRRAMIIFTSGTTSKPKGVVSTHRNIQAQVSTLIDFWEWQADDVIPLFLPMHHVHGIINVMTCALWAGARVDAFAEGFKLAQICARVAAGAYTLFMAVPTIYVKIIRGLEQMSEQERTRVCAGFSGMRLMISGSAALPVRIHENWQQLTGQVLLERYGMTEIGMGLSNPLHGERRPGAVGVPLPGVQVQLVSEAGEVIAGEDEPGELRVKSDTVFLEYWQNPKATQESFRDGWFLTGDMAVRERGYYRIMGRLSVDIIKSGGYKLSALEIENYLLAHEAIAECAVIGLEDETWGEVVAAVVVLQPGAELTLESLKDWASGQMSGYKIPRVLKLVDSLPRNAMGKVTKPQMKQLL